MKEVRLKIGRKSVQSVSNIKQPIDGTLFFMPQLYVVIIKSLLIFIYILAKRALSVVLVVRELL